MRVSVIIPTLNREALLAQTLESALRQTLAPHEIIVVDDGSTDQTPELMASYTSRYECVRSLRLPANQGADRARQVGFEHSHGEYLAFLDSDDVWLPTHLERCVQTFSARPGVAMVFSRYGVMDSRGQILVPTVREPRLSSPPLRSLLFKRLIVQYSRAVYARQAVLAVGGVPASVTADDWVLDVLIALRFPAGIVPLPDCTVLSRFHAGNSARNPAKMRDSLLRSTEQLFAALPAEWQPAKSRVMAINLLHSAVFFWHAGAQAEAWRCLSQAVRIDPPCVTDRSFRAALARLLVHASAGRLLQTMKHGLQRRRSAASVDLATFGITAHR